MLGLQARRKDGVKLSVSMTCSDVGLTKFDAMPVLHASIAAERKQILH